MRNLYLLSKKDFVLTSLRLLLRAACAMLFCAMVCPLQSWAQWIQQQELTASDGITDAGFGYSVAISEDGSTMVIGAGGALVGSNTEQGKAYVFVKSGASWTQQAELTSSDGAAYDNFGGAVAISGSTIVVGAKCAGPRASGFSGCAGPGTAYVFVQNSGVWTQHAELTASDGEAFDLFGSSVAISGGTIVVGAPGHLAVSNANSGSVVYGKGAAYVFAQTGGLWAQQAELTAVDGVASDNFGGSVAISGSTIVVGASSHPKPANNVGAGPGAAYVFTQTGTTWTQQAELTASDGAAGDDFGFSVAVSGGSVVVGALYHGDQGAAYVFTQGGGPWTQQAELTASDGAAGDEFGGPVAIAGNTMVIGAASHTVGSNVHQGAAYVFTQKGMTWAQQAELTASDGVAGDLFGTSAAVSGSTIVAGAPRKTIGSNMFQGAAYVFAPPPVVTFSGSPQQPLTTDGSGNYMAQVTITNTGNVTVSSLQLTSATLGSGSLLTTPAAITNLRAGQSAVVTLTFPPSSVPTGATRAALKMNGTYLVTSASLSGNWALSFRSVNVR